jgi:flagellar motor switch protein FliN
MDEEQEEPFIEGEQPPPEEEPVVEEEQPPPEVEPVVEEEAPLPPEEKEEEEPLVPRTSIPITITVELGKVKMNADKVLGLEPGNLLELNRAPGERVDLISGGKKIGTGELLRVGDVLGVRILELG